MQKNFPSKFKNAEESPGFLLWTISNKWQRLQKEALKPLGLTHVQFVLLATTAYLKKIKGPPTQALLAETAKTDPMMTSQVVRTLSKKGYLKRSDHPIDSRAFLLNLTEKGQKILQKALPIVENIDAEFFNENAKKLLHSLNRR